ncbi:MAG: glycyl-radical enzyme activating protein [Chloroflexi bacterium]|nr:glycyl-radical enzyme activating protein [Chloroflexota bacterium]
MTSGLVFDIQRYSLHDGPGLRTLVFLKGCPLRCLWCSNPESQERAPELLYDAARCTMCLACVRACPSGALSHTEGQALVYDRERCTVCGACVRACPSEARRIVGSTMAVDEVLSVVLRDMPFYRRSGGGVTLGGGEPTYQAAFARSLLDRFSNHGLNTAIETCGQAETRAFLSVAQAADRVYFDIKHLNRDTHIALTGVSNELILDNLTALLHVHGDVVVRYPLVPGCNDGDSDLRALADHLLRVPRVPPVEFVPYHRFGEHKYRLLGRDYELAGTPSCDEQETDAACAILRQFGLECSALSH